MRYRVLILMVIVATAALQSTATRSQSPDFVENVYYVCNGERMIVTRCRKDSDQPGFPPTQPGNDYCQVYYPDRPKVGGFDASAVELRSDLIKKLEACTRADTTHVRPSAAPQKVNSPSASMGSSSDDYTAQGERFRFTKCS